MTSDQAYFDQLFSNGTQAFKNRNFKNAALSFNQLIRKFPNRPDPYHMLALIKSQNQDYDQAIKFYQHAIQLNPKNADYLINCAEAMQRIGRDQEAISHLQKVIALKPNIYPAKHKLAVVLKKIGQYDKASILFQEVLAHNPNFTAAAFQLGTLMLETGNLNKAKGFLKSALTSDSKSVKTLNNLGVICQQQNEYEQAIKYYLDALAIDSSYEDACRNLAIIYEKIGNDTEAKKYYLMLAKICNDDPLILWKAELIEPCVFKSLDKIENYRKKILTELNNVKCQKIGIDVDQLINLAIQPPSGIIYNGQDDLPIKQAYADLFKGIPKIPLRKEVNEKPKIGFVVTCGHEGVFVKCMAGILNNISTQKLEISLICSFPNGQKMIQPHIVNNQINFVSLPKSLGLAVKVLADLNFDVLHYWEVGTDPYNYFIPFFKPARIQCTSWGWPITSGNSEIDYFISCKSLECESSSMHYSENLVLFEKLPVYYERPELPEFDMTLSDFGIKEGQNIYLCTQNLKKVHSDFDQIVGSILEQDQKGIVVFLGDSYPLITDKLKRRLYRKVPRLKERIVFLRRLELKAYYNMVSLAGVILDTLHYGGGANTNYDAFAVGTPVVTMPTKYHRGKFTAAAYEQMGIIDLIAGSIEEYADLAYKLANDSNFRNRMRSKINENSHKVFEDEDAVLELEHFFIDIVEKRQNF